MTKKFYLIIIILGFIRGSLQSQIYVGSQDFGQLRIISDSTLNLSFYGWPSFGTIVPEDQLCTYTHSHDTMFVSTNNTPPLELTYENGTTSTSECGEPVIVYCFTKNPISGYEYSWKGAYIFDTVTRQIHIKRRHWTPCEELYVVEWGYFSNRGIVYPDSSKSAVGDYDIIITKGENSNCLFMKRFPLLIKGKKIVPLSTEKNEKFWVDNGFYFPTFHTKSNPCDFWVIPHHERGLNGLKFDRTN